MCVYSQSAASVDENAVIYSSVITFRKAVSVSPACSPLRFFIKVMCHCSFGWDVAGCNVTCCTEMT